MIIGFLCLVLAMIGGCFIVRFGLEMRSVELGGLIGVVGSFITIMATIIALFYGVFAYSWIASDHRANIINREYGTNYTREEVFYASSVIEIIRELDRKRIEVNGDLFREKSK